MTKEFIPYQQAVQLKKLEFNEDCFGYYENENQDQKLVISYNNLPLTEEQQKRPSMYKIDNRNSGLPQWATSAPTYSQVFRWFRDNHGLYHHILPEFYTTGINFNWQIFWYLPKEEWTKHLISDGTGLYGDNGEYPTQEDAELACLKQLIEIIDAKIKNR